jgi:hypothetical protein
VSAAEPVATHWRVTPEEYVEPWPLAQDWQVRVPGRRLPAVVRYLDRHRFPDDHQGGAAIFFHPASPAELEAMQQARGHGIRVLVMVDENALDETAVGRDEIMVPGEGIVTVSPAFAAETRATHRQAVQLADGVIVATEAQKGHYAPLGTPVFVIPQAVEPADWPEPWKADDGVFRIGFAAAPHPARRIDLDLLQPALEWASGQPGVEAILFGINPLRHDHPDDGPDPLLGEVSILQAQMSALTPEQAGRARAWVGKLEIRKEAWRFPMTRWCFVTDLDEYRRALRWFDVGLAPCDPRNVARSATDTKLLDYAMSGAYPIASDAPPYDEWGGPAHLARGAQGFLEGVQWAVANQDEVRERAMAAREHVFAQRTIETNLWRWREALGGGR